MSYSGFMRRRTLEEGNSEFDRLRKLNADYKKLQDKVSEAGDLVRGEAARLVRHGHAIDARGWSPAVARVTGWSAEYAHRLGRQVDDEGNRLPEEPEDAGEPEEPGDAGTRA